MSLARKGALGKGLAQLIPDNALSGDAPTRTHLRVVALEEIRPNPNQPREYFDPALLSSLSESIRQHGILQPLVVRREAGHFVLISGERRFRASKLAGLTEVPVIIREAEEGSVQLELALVENLQRSDLDPIESARGYARLMEEYGYTQDEVAQRVGKERPTVANALRLLRLPDFVLDAVRDNSISAGHARALLPVNDADLLAGLVKKIVDQQLSVRATEKLVAQSQKVIEAGPRLVEPVPEPELPSYEYAHRLLAETLHTLVQIKARRDGGGSVVIEFSNADELDRLVTLVSR